LVDPIANTNACNIEVSSLKYPYKEFLWLFSRIIGLESTAFVSKNVVYILHFFVHEDILIDWGCLISNEISFQLGGLKRTQKFYMTSYLIFAIAYYHIFEDFLRARSVDSKVEPVSFWYLALWRHRAQDNLYPVYNNFIFEFKKIIFGPNTSRLSLEVATFLSKKGIFETT
jgi:hypothetical protein